MGRLYRLIWHFCFACFLIFDFNILNYSSKLFLATFLSAFVYPRHLICNQFTLSSVCIFLPEFHSSFDKFFKVINVTKLHWNYHIWVLSASHSNYCRPLLWNKNYSFLFGKLYCRVHAILLHLSVPIFQLSFLCGDFSNFGRRWPL